MNIDNFFSRLLFFVFRSASVRSRYCYKRGERWRLCDTDVYVHRRHWTNGSDMVVGWSTHEYERNQSYSSSMLEWRQHLIWSGKVKVSVGSAIQTAKITDIWWTQPGVGSWLAEWWRHYLSCIFRSMIDELKFAKLVWAMVVDIHAWLKMKPAKQENISIWQF